MTLMKQTLPRALSNVKNTLTFDPSAGVAYGVNLTINTGADLDADYTVVGTSVSFDYWIYWFCSTCKVQ